MIELLVKFYKKKVTSYRLVFRFMRMKYTLLRISFFLFMVSVLPMIYGLLIGLVWTEFRTVGIWFLILFIFTLLILIFMFSLVNKKAKIIVKQKYDINPSGWPWRTPEFETMQIDILKEHLNRNHLYTENKIKLLIEGLEKDIEKSKFPSLINPGIFISLFVPIWIQYLTFKYKMITTEEQAISTLVVSTFSILMIIVLVNVIKRFSNELKELIFIDDNIYKKMLLEKLEDTLLRYREDQDL
ncbi:hypothetical protein QD46_21925 [Paenibacillus polymyxa]|nr:hypothetical protein QD46_21925 [Paenibacillus polymyxa]